MKQTVAISVIVLSIGYIYAAPRAGAQERNAEAKQNSANPFGEIFSGVADLSPLEAAKSQYQAAEHRARRLAIELLKQAAEKSPNAIASDRQALREKLKPLVEESFNARQRLQQEELKALRRRLAEIERAIEDRAAHKEAIVNSRVDALADSAMHEIARKHGEMTQGDQPGKVAPLRNQFRHEGANGESIPLGVSPPAPVGPPVALPDAPPGMEARVRYVQVQIEEDGALKTVTKPVVEFVKVGQAGAAHLDGAAAATNPALPISPPGTTEASASVSEGFDLDTRQRLALLELQPAQDKIDEAEQALSYARKMHEKGYASELEVSSREKDLRHAAIELRRVKVKLSGIDSERAELQAVAESALAEAAAEVERATAKVAVAEAKAAAAVAQKGHFNAVIEAAQSNYEVLDKTYTRLRELATAEKSVPARQVDEAQEKLAAAKATLAGARAAAATGGANIDESKAAVAEARAELQIAETRRRAAQARLDRLTRQAASEPGEEFAPGADSSQPQDSRRKQSEPAGDREAAE